MDGSLICGGGWDPDAQTSCLQWNSTSGTWYKSHSLWRTRKQHCSWTPGPGTGTYLLGPDGDGMSSELVAPDGSVRPEGPAFSQEFRSLTSKSILIKASSFNRLACSITDSTNQRVIITGGHSFGLSLKTVSIFDSNEYIGRMGSLINARESHGCTSYSVVGETVKIHNWYQKTLIP